jgi:hypothetical protein
MRIAIVAGFNDFDYKGWTRGFAFADQFEFLGHQVQAFNLYNIDNFGNYLGYTDDQLKYFVDQQDNFDFVLLLDCINFSSPLFSYINIPSIIETANDPLAFAQNINKAQYFDIVISPDKRCVENYRSNGLNAYWFQPWVDPKIHLPLHNIVDKTVVGIPRGWSGEGIYHFMRTKLRDSWEDSCPNTRYDLNIFLNRGKIVFCHSHHGGLINLMFEAAACSRVVLMNRLDPNTGIYNLFKENVDIIYYSNWKDALNKIKYLESNPDDIKTISKNGWNKIMDYHTIGHRVNTIIDIIQRNSDI